MNEITTVFTPAVIECDFDGMGKRLDGLLEPYDGCTAEAVAAMPIEDVKSCSKDLKSMRKELDEGRKAIKREYNRPLDEFEKGVKALIARIDAPLSLFTEAEAIHEAARKEEKADALRRVYEDAAPALVGVVPFERIMDQRWLNKTFSQKKAEDELMARVQSIADNWDALKCMALNYPEEAEREYFATLDLAKAVTRDREIKAERDRIDAMRADVDANRAASCGASMQDGGATEPADMGADAGTGYMQQVERIPEHTDEPVNFYAMEFEATESQKRALIAECRRIGIHGNLRRIQAAEADDRESDGQPDIPSDYVCWDVLHG